MNSIWYFAYGSNLLTARLTMQCPTARPVGVTFAEGFSLDFSKPGVDGSGKATLAPSDQGTVRGALYVLDARDLAALDRAEAGYRRIEDFAVAGRNERVVTYIAERPRSGLAPYDWYLALVVAGAHEHGLDADYVSSLRAHSYTEDTRPECAFRTQAHRALQLAGHHAVRDVLG